MKGFTLRIVLFWSGTERRSFQLCNVSFHTVDHKFMSRQLKDTKVWRYLTTFLELFFQCDFATIYDILQTFQAQSSILLKNEKKL